MKAEVIRVLSEFFLCLEELLVSKNRFATADVREK